MKKIIISVNLLLLSFVSNAMEVKQSTICKENKCINVEGLENKKTNNKKLTEVYKVKKENGVWEYSDTKLKFSETLDLSSDKMNNKISIINK